MPEVLDPPTTPQPDINNVKRYRPPAIDKAVVETAKGLYLQGNSLKAIAQQLNLNPVTVRYWSFKQRWPELVVKVKRVSQLTVVKVNANVGAPAQSEQSNRLRSMLATEVEAQAIALASVPPKASDLPNKPERQGRAAVLKTLVESASMIHDWDSQHTPGIVLVGEVERAIEQSETPIEIESQVSQDPSVPEPTTGSVPPA